MKKSNIIFIVLICLTLCSCSPLKKSIVNGDKDKTTEDIIENNSNSKVSINSQEQLKEEFIPPDGPDTLRQDDQVEVKKDTAPEAQKPQIIEKKPLGPGYVVKVDISDQKVYIYKDGVQVKAMTCSTGIKGSETPEGKYKIVNKQNWFFSEKFQQGGKYWVGFIGGEYGFHSVPTDRGQTIIEEEAVKLGTPASHGCVRLSENDAEWFFNTIPYGSKVEIQK